MFKARVIGSAVLMLAFSLIFLVNTSYSDEPNPVFETFEAIEPVEDTPSAYIYSEQKFGITPDGRDETIWLDPADAEDARAIEHYFFEDSLEPNPVFETFETIEPVEDTPSAYIYSEQKFGITPDGRNDTIWLDPADPEDSRAIDHYFGKEGYDVDAGYDKADFILEESNREVFTPELIKPSALFDDNVLQIETQPLMILESLEESFDYGTSLRGKALLEPLEESFDYGTSLDAQATLDAIEESFDYGK